MTGRYTVEARGEGRDRCYVVVNPDGDVIFADPKKRLAQASADHHNTHQEDA